MLRRIVSDPRFIRIVVIVGCIATNVFFFGGMPVEASAFFALGALHGVLLFRVVSHSGRAAFVMVWASRLMLVMTLPVEGSAGIPITGPLLMGFAAGATVGAYRWTGRLAGAELKRKRERRADGSYTGGWRLALINLACAAVLLGFSFMNLSDGAPQTAILILAVGFLAGWTLYRFGSSQQVKFITLISLAAAFVPAIVVAGRFGYGHGPFIAALGLMAGILIGGRHWWGPKFGEPRPPFAGSAKRRRRKKPKRKPATAPRKKANAPAPG